MVAIVFLFRKMSTESDQAHCSVCEQRLSTAEGRFAREVFFPFHEGSRIRFPYDEWLLYFAVSLAWRCSVTSDETQLQKFPQHIQPVKAARAAWADFLLGRVNSVAPYRFNIFFTPAGVTSVTHLPDGLAWYLLRSPDATPVHSKARTAIYVKLPGMFFWTSVQPPDPGGWRGTRIGRRGTLRLRGQAIEEPGVGEFLVDRVETVFQRMSTLSEKQRRRIDETIRRQPDRAANSKSVEALLEDERIRGENRRKRGSQRR